MRAVTKPPFRRAAAASMLGLAVLLGSLDAEAQYFFGLQLHVGMSGEAETEDFQIDGGNALPWGEGQEDLEDQFGLSGYIVSLLSPHVGLGGRVAYLTADGEDTNNDYDTIDLGPWLRLQILSGPIRPFFDVGAGVSHVWAENDSDEWDAKGFGWHLMLGGGVNFSVSQSVSLHPALYYGYQSFPGVEGEWHALADDVGFEVDGTIDRLLFTVGFEVE